MSSHKRAETVLHDDLHNRPPTCRFPDTRAHVESGPFP